MNNNYYMNHFRINLTNEKGFKTIPSLDNDKKNRYSLFISISQIPSSNFGIIFYSVISLSLLIFMYFWVGGVF